MLRRVRRSAGLFMVLLPDVVWAGRVLTAPARLFVLITVSVVTFVRSVNWVDSARFLADG